MNKKRGYCDTLRNTAETCQTLCSLLIGFCQFIYVAQVEGTNQSLLSEALVLVVLPVRDTV